MAANMPSTLPRIALRHFIRGRPVVAGEVAADKDYGFRGLNDECNHGYGYRVHTVTTCSSIWGSSYELIETATWGSWTVLGGYGVHHLGDDVAELRLTVDIERGQAQIEINDSETADTASVTTRSQPNVTVTLDSGDIGDVIKYRIKVKASKGYTLKLYRYAIEEVRLGSGDLP